jgi:hypothetical protein
MATIRQLGPGIVAWFPAVGRLVFVDGRGAVTERSVTAGLRIIEIVPSDTHLAAFVELPGDQGSKHLAFVSALGQVERVVDNVKWPAGARLVGSRANQLAVWRRSDRDIVWMTVN